MKLFPPKNQAQDGMTLLLAVMIVSGIALISVSVAFFVMQEIRNSRSTVYTEPAIIAAETAGEQGIYEVKRGTFSADCATAAYTQLDGSTTSGSANTRIRKCIKGDDATYQLFAGQPKKIYLFDPNNINGNRCLETTCDNPDLDGGGTGAQLFETIELTYITGSFSVDVDVSSLGGVPYTTATLSPGGTRSISIDRDIVNMDDERLVITLEPTAGTATVNINTTGSIGGLPEMLTLQADGCVSINAISGCDVTDEAFRRSINVTLPR